MFKYFCSEIKGSINTAGSKAIWDMQRTIERFLEGNRIQYKRYSFDKIRNLFYIAFPSPYSKYLLFGYTGLPIFNPPFVVAYLFVFCLVALKKRIAKERFYLIVTDLIEWQSVLWTQQKNSRYRWFRVFQCSLERVLVSHVADEVISLFDNSFMIRNYSVRKIHNLKFLGYYVSSPRRLEVAPRDRKLLYAGDLGRDSEIEFLIEVLKNLESSYKLVVAGYGLKEHLEKELQKFENFLFLGQLDVEKLDEVARECQFGLIIYPPERFYYNIVPLSKTSLYIANGLTVISTNLKRIKELNDEYDFGYVLPKEEMLQLIRALSVVNIKENRILEEQIANGHFLYKALAELDVS